MLYYVSKKKVTEGITYVRKQIDSDTNDDESSHDTLYSVIISLDIC